MPDQLVETFSLDPDPALTIRRGGGASQLTIANGGAFAEVRQWDLAPFIQDDWKQFTPLGTGGGSATSNRSLALRAQFSF